MQTFHCEHCGGLVFFENVRCEACGHTLGYLTDVRTMGALAPAADGLWRSGGGRLYRMCRNYAVANVCNWMLPAQDPHSLCESCRLTEIIPALGLPPNLTYWYRLEQAKRRLIYTLSALGLTPPGKAEDANHGLAFRFLADDPETGKVITGHDHGTITLNIAEADDARRERTRAQLGEPYRTLLGHFRHEIGHYYWDRLIDAGARQTAFRQRFGDERADYDASLQRHYQQGPPADWQQHYVSSYASAHPWEDWAETWAQYLQLVDALETARACGLELTPAHPADPALAHAAPADATDSFERMIAQWFSLSYVLNNLHRSLGMPEGYQFSLSAAVVDKLRFVHEVVRSQNRGTGQA